MQFVKGTVVRSKAGHDKGSFFVVNDIEAQFAYIVDGKGRTLKNPKKKNILHLAATNTVLDERTMETDIEIRKTLSVFNKKVQQSFI